VKRKPLGTILAGNPTLPRSRRPTPLPLPIGALLAALACALPLPAQAPGAAATAAPSAVPRPPPATASSAVAAPANPAPAPPDAAALEAAIAQEVAHAARATPNVAVRIVELGQHAFDYAYRADAHMLPASNQKLLTTAAALATFGSGYTFDTQVGLRGSVGADGVLAGDLAVRGAGDPTISGRENGDPYAVFRRWAAALRARGVRRVAGDLYLEHGLFSGPLVHADWPPEQRQWWYEAPVAALSFDDNCQLLRGWAGRTVGSFGVLEAVPHVDVLTLQNRLRTVRRGAHWAVHRAGGSRLVQVVGEVSASNPPLEVWVTVEDPVEYFGEALRAALAQEGVEIAGKTRPVERLPGPWWELVTHQRSLLVSAVEVTNKRSQNFYAESFFKLLGARVCGEGSFTGGARAVSDFLARTVGWPRDQFHVSDGSGLARSDWVTADGMVRLLDYVFRQPYGVDFLRSLPFAGEPDASLHSRLTEAPYRGNVFAKTGTIEGVSTLSGYAKGRSGRLYAFSILVNGAAAWTGRVAQDRLLQVLVDNG
jgi:D-alanyl-D-alanine carboxypeptidase/D-alanyl-D-alanine-endopeptidase (penicillin-binding protein 4)